jgi:hypothetical protein
MPDSLATSPLSNGASGLPCVSLTLFINFLNLPLNEMLHTESIPTVLRLVDCIVPEFVCFYLLLAHVLFLGCLRVSNVKKEFVMVPCFV